MENWKYFSLQELCASDTARRLHIENVPDSAQLENLDRLVTTLLDPLREIWGSPLIVSSGFRCKELNKLVGGVSNSYHLWGLAADIVAPSTLQRSSWVNNMWLFKLIKQNMKALGVDEVIAEKSSGRRCQWVHVQIPIFGISPRYKAFCTYSR